jgi:hypothetical protein
MTKNIRSIFSIIYFSLFTVSIAFSQPLTVTLDNISKEMITKFDRASAILDKRTLVTSIQNNAVIPNNYLYPVIEWQRPENYDDAFLIELKSSSYELNVLLKNNSWQPDGNEFGKFLKDKEVLITLYFLDKGKTCKTQPVRLVISERSLKDDIAFRVVQPLFDPALPNAIKLFSFDQKAPKTLLEFGGTCVGCHSYSPNSAYFNIKRGTERKLVMARHSNQKFEFNPLKQLEKREFSFFAITRTGRYAVFVVNAFGGLTVKKTLVEPFDFPYFSADIFCYDVEKDTFTSLKGASDPKFIEDMPFFSPDGKYLLFTRYGYVMKDQIMSIPSMDLYKVPFNDGKGGDPIPIKNASFNNKHQYFPRYAPNGKWISFCRGDAQKGVYARKSSDIYLLSADENTVTRLNLNMDNTMDSWHDWSSDSHWLLFSSNREKSSLTALYLVYIDDNGKDYPPAKLVGYKNMKVNTPQFVPKDLSIESVKNLNLRNYIDSIFTTPKK